MVSNIKMVGRTGVIRVSWLFYTDPRAPPSCGLAESPTSSNGHIGDPEALHLGSGCHPADSSRVFSDVWEDDFLWGAHGCRAENTEETQKLLGNYVAHQRFFLDSLSRKIQPLVCLWAKPFGWRMWRSEVKLPWWKQPVFHSGSGPWAVELPFGFIQEECSHLGWHQRKCG